MSEDKSAFGFWGTSLYGQNRRVFALEKLTWGFLKEKRGTHPPIPMPLMPFPSLSSRQCKQAIHIMKSKRERRRTILADV